MYSLNFWRNFQEIDAAVWDDQQRWNLPQLPKPDGWHLITHREKSNLSIEDEEQQNNTNSTLHNAELSWHQLHQLCGDFKPNPRAGFGLVSSQTGETATSSRPWINKRSWEEQNGTSCFQQWWPRFSSALGFSSSGVRQRKANKPASLKSSQDALRVK